MDIVRAIGGKEFTANYYQNVSDGVRKFSNSKFYEFKLFAIANASILIFISIYVAFNVKDL